MLPKRFRFITIPDRWEEEVSARIILELLQHGDCPDSHIAKSAKTNKMRVGRIRAWLQAAYPELRKDPQAQKLWSANRTTPAGRSWTRRTPPMEVAEPDFVERGQITDWRDRVKLFTEDEFKAAGLLEDLLGEGSRHRLKPTTTVSLVLTELPRVRLPHNMWNTLCDRALPFLSIHGRIALILHQVQLVELMKSLEALQLAKRLEKGPSKFGKVLFLGKKWASLLAQVRNPRDRKNSFGWLERFVGARIYYEWLLALPRKHRYKRWERDPTWGTGISEWKPVAVFRRRPSWRFRGVTPLEGPDLLSGGNSSANQLLFGCRQIIRSLAGPNPIVLDPFPNDPRICLASLYEHATFIAVFPNAAALTKYYAKVERALSGPNK